jgi:hypothetical protein
MVSNLSKLLSATIIIVLIMLAATTGEVFSAGTYNIISNTNSASLIASGTTASDNSGITFGSVTINMAGVITPISKTDFIRIDNSVTPKNGWNVTVSAANFTATVTDYSSAVGGATLTVNIPANTILTVKPQAPTASGSVSLTGVSAQNTSGFAVASTAVKVLSAAASGCGAGCGFSGNNGYYMQQLNYTLTIPNYLPTTATITGAQADSKFIPANRTAGAKIGLFAGTYSSTITYAIGVGP